MNKKTIAKEYDLHEVVANVLYKRGYYSENDLNNFLNPSPGNLNNYKKIPNANKIKDKIMNHIEFGSKIYVFGDYDVDGVCSTALLSEVLKKMGGYVEGKISDRFKGGYSFSKQEIDEMNDGDLIISLDCGISSQNNIKYAQKKGIDFIVIDHHEQDKNVNVDYIDLKVNQGYYPFAELSGAGITWKFCQYLLDYNLYDMLDLVALSTIADMVPLKNENRIITKMGLEKMNNQPQLGLKQLILENGIDKVNVGNIAYKVAPCINAQGRLKNNQISYELLTTTDYSKSLSISRKLYEINEKRKMISEKGLQIAQKQVEKDNNFIVVQGDFKAGVVGLIASDIKEKYNKPVIVFGGGDDVVKGSGRSVSPLHLYDTLQELDDLFERLGGHKKAIGCSIKKENISELKEKLNEMTQDIKYKKHWYDVELPLNKINEKLVNDLNVFEPCGIGNPQPRFLFESKPQNIKLSKDDKHLFFDLGKYRCVAFNKGDKVDKLQNKFVGSLNFNEWRGKKNIQINIKNIL
ncbi:MAG: single-stranded-DNA-specific exonuclease RecJ [Bacillota bacterium]